MTSSKYNSINYVKYLNNCDLNYKYFLKSINETPVLDKIVFELPTNMLSNIETTEDDYKTCILLKCFLAFYFINLKMPYINCNRFKNPNIIKGATSNFHYAYLTTYNSLVEKHKLMSVLFNENDRYNAGIKTLTKINKKTKTNKYKTNSLNFKLEIEALRVVEYKDILIILFSKAELHNLKFKLNIVFKNFNNKISSTEEFKNFFYMWNI